MAYRQEYLKGKGGDDYYYYQQHQHQQQHQEEEELGLKKLSVNDPYGVESSTTRRTSRGNTTTAAGTDAYDDLPPPYVSIVDQRTLGATEPAAHQYYASLSSSDLPSIPSAPIPDASTSQLSKPIAIPATNAKLGSPFLRAYPPILESHYSISKSTFLVFLDDLNRVAVANPPLQILGLAGNVVSFVPLPTAQMVGRAVGIAAKVGTVAVSKGRTELFLRKANAELFGPRGLQVEIAKLDALAKLAGIPILNAEGKIDKHAPVLAPLQPVQGPATMSYYDNNTLSGQQRRLDTLQPWIEHLDLTPLPQLHVPENPLSKLSAGASERMRKHGEAKLISERDKAHHDYRKESAKAEKDFRKEMAKLDEDEAKIHRKHDGGRKEQKEMAKIEKERAKVLQDYEKEMGKVEEDKIKDDKEEEVVRKILWLIIRAVGVRGESEGEGDAAAGGIAVGRQGGNPYLEE